MTSITPLGAADGSDGYRVTSERSGAWVRRRPETVTARGVVVAAGALGTNNLLANCRHSGALPRLSGRKARRKRSGLKRRERRRLMRALKAEKAAAR